MCTQPITKINDKGDFSSLNDKAYNTFACGKCPSCLSEKQSAWQMRSANEYKSCISAGGWCIYITLTYDNEHLPVLDLDNLRIEDFQTDPFVDVKYTKIISNESKTSLTPTILQLRTMFDRGVHYVANRKNIEVVEASPKGVCRYVPLYLKILGKGEQTEVATNILPSSLGHATGDNYTQSQVPCFDKRIVQNYKKRIQTYAKRHYGVSLVRSFLCSEYGSQFGRPHHHALFYFYPDYDKINSEETRNNAIANTIALLQNEWTYGISKFGSLGALVTSDVASKYVAKYITKDMTYNANYDRFMDEVRKNPVYAPYSQHFETLLRKVMPFHLQSTNYGFFNGGQYLDETEDMLNKLQMYSTDANGQIHIVSMPLYYKRKLFFETNSDGKYFLNVRGRENFANQMNERITRFSERMRTIGDKVLEIGVENKHFSPKYVRGLESLGCPHDEYTTFCVSFLATIPSNVFYNVSIYNNLLRNYNSLNKQYNENLDNDPFCASYHSEELSSISLDDLISLRYPRTHEETMCLPSWLRSLILTSPCYIKLENLNRNDYFEKILYVYYALQNASDYVRSSRYVKRTSALNSLKEQSALNGHVY